VQIHFFETQKPSDLAGAFAAMKGAGVDGLVLQEASLFNVRSVSQQIADLALEGRLPAMCQHALFVRAGCLMSYGPDFVDIWRRAGVYVAKILDGATPAELPVEQPIKFELSINMKTANAIGLTIPSSIMLRADRVIE
jgi:putative ABC transport system substrate-binding protein